MKPHREGYLKMSFKDFVEEFDKSEDNHILWLSLASSFMNSFSLLVDDKEGFEIIISKFRLQQLS